MRAARFALLALALSTSFPGAAPAQLAPPVETRAPTAPPATTQPAAPAPAPAEAQPARTRTKGDPFEGFNRRMFAFNQKFDRAIFGPLALTTGKVIPKPVRSGIRNFLRNLGEPIVFLNDLLQLKPKRALQTLARFTINSTIGVGGLVDVAKSAKLPHRGNSFGNTLAHYGVGPGPYLFLPLVGPTTLRDIGAQQLDRAVLPVAIGSPFNRLDWQLGTGVLAGIDQRITADDDLRALLGGAADPYATLRSVYLQNRKAEIEAIKGKAAATTMFDDPLDDPAATPPPAGAPGAPSPEGPPSTDPDPSLADPAAQPEQPPATADPAAPAADPSVTPADPAAPEVAPAPVPQF